jgi:hypothetical protein
MEIPFGLKMGNFFSSSSSSFLPLRENRTVWNVLKIPAGVEHQFQFCIHEASM